MKMRSLLLGLFLLAGCVPILVVGSLVTGYGLSNDSAVGRINIGYHDLWVSCLDKLEALHAGTIVGKESDGLIKAKMADVDITIRIDSLSNDVQRLKVSARKYLVPKPHIAQDVFFKITKDLK